MEREQRIIKTSIIGIIANVLLAGFKVFVGIVSSSVAVILDAVNNLSDAMSSLLTIIGTKLGAKAPDKKHPLGYGRIEYLSTMVISVIIIYAGVTSLVESIKKIINPVVPDYSTTSLVIITVAIAVKLFLGNYVKNVGEELDSSALVASGLDARFDALISASTLVAAIIFLITGYGIEAELGVVIALFIIKSGVDIMKGTVSELLGERVKAELSKAVKETICEFEEVLGAYDLTIHNYGPDRLIGSVHIEVSDTLTARELDILERKITKTVTKKHCIVMTGISVYAVNTQDEEAIRIRTDVENAVKSLTDITEMHGFYLDKERESISFDVIIDFDAEDKETVLLALKNKIKENYPNHRLYITQDYDISD